MVVILGTLKTVKFGTLLAFYKLKCLHLVTVSGALTHLLPVVNNSTAAVSYTTIGKVIDLWTLCWN
jgi:hypothetical protein